MGSLIEGLGADRAQKAVHQALHLQCMNVNLSTLPVFFCEICGIALTNIHLVLYEKELSCFSKRKFHPG